jgi:hypothetical protein
MSDSELTDWETYWKTDWEEDERLALSLLTGNLKGSEVTLGAEKTIVLDRMEFLEGAEERAAWHALRRCLARRSSPLPCTPKAPGPDKLLELLARLADPDPDGEMPRKLGLVRRKKYGRMGVFGSNYQIAKYVERKLKDDVSLTDAIAIAAKVFLKSEKHIERIYYAQQRLEASSQS